METVDPEEGDFCEGIYLRPVEISHVSRPGCVRPVEPLPGWLQDSNSRATCESKSYQDPRADVHVRRKHHADGRPNGDVYLRAENNSIVRIAEGVTRFIVERSADYYALIHAC